MRGIVITKIQGIIFVLIFLVVIFLIITHLFSGQEKEGFMNLPRGVGISLESADTKIFVLPTVVWFGKNLRLNGVVNFDDVFDEDNSKSTDFIFPTNNVYIKEVVGFPSTENFGYLGMLSSVLFTTTLPPGFLSLFTTSTTLTYIFTTTKPISPVIAFYPLVTDNFFGSLVSNAPANSDSINGQDIYYLNPKKPFGSVNFTLTIDPKELYKHYRLKNEKFDRAKAEENIRLSVSYFTDKSSEKYYKAHTITLETLGAPETEDINGKTCEIKLTSCCDPPKLKVEYDGETETGILIKNEIVTIAGLDIYTKKAEYRDTEVQVGAARTIKDLIDSGECKEDSGKYNCSFSFNTSEKCCPSFVYIKPVFRVNLTKKDVSNWETEEIDPIYFQVIYYLDVLEDEDFIFENFKDIQNLFKDEDKVSPVKDILIYPCRAIARLDKGQISLLPSRVKSFDRKIIDWSECESATTKFIQLKYKNLYQNSTWFCKKDSSGDYLLYNPYAFCRLNGEGLPEIPTPTYLQGIIPSGNLSVKWGPWIIPDITYKEYHESALIWAFHMIDTVTETLKNGDNIDFPEDDTISTITTTITITYNFN